MKKTILISLMVTIYVTLIFPYLAQAQFELNGQLVQRAEYRNGFGKLINENADPAAFVSQRLRLQANYATSRVRFYSSIQDIRTWGSTSQVKITDGFLSLHEGWAEVSIDSGYSIKVGRQELNYDNSRFLGNLDWALQGRAHDFGLFKYEEGNTKIHIGGGYNQNSENLSDNLYTIPNQYKTAQMIWYNYKKSVFEVSGLFWNNGKEALTLDSTGKTIDHTVRMSQTLGISNIKYSFWEDNIVSGFAYYQFGKDATNKSISAYDVSFQAAQTVPINQTTNMKFTIGAELISGTSANATDNINASFSPLYGTNHVHNGYMDYFYVGGRNENSTGLNDIFFRMRYDVVKKWFVTADIHYFISNASIYRANTLLDNELGAEIDLTGGFVLSEECSLQLGYSQMIASATLKALQSSSAASSQNWAYLMLIVRPKSDKKFIGVLP